ncbi:MAG TPA: hypothetical protein VLB44_22700 [Kofleriaceae bacterium]|nr:hypothetical protein [Kofleriaceae bacterium]
MDKTRFMFAPVAMAFVLTAASSTASAEEARDFIEDAKVFYRVVSCGAPDTAVPDGLDQKTVDAHCAQMAKTYEYTKSHYLEPASAFFASLRPKDLPTTVVYPFGGGDLLSALVTYPDAKDITTISLEHAGDPTRLAKLKKKADLRQHLSDFRAAVDGLLRLHDSTSENMMKLEVGGIPGQLSFHITGMTVHGYEPVSLKYFTFNDDGTLHYLTQTEIDAMAKKKAKKIRSKWVDTDFSEAFNNMELTFRKAGDPKAPLIVHRHIAWSLDDKKFKGSPLEKYLLAKGKVVAMTKAASYLLWNGYFSGIREYLTGNMVWMASDATGVPPKFAKKAGFTQTTYGTFKGAFLEEFDPNVNEQMIKLWESQPRRKLPFRYGYPDSEKHVHLMITAPAPPPKDAPK